MTDLEQFQNLIRRVRAGDAEAAAELVRRYEADVRRVVRVRMSSLSRVMDSMDICQSVLGRFFQRAQKGEFDLEKPEQLVKLLMRMAKNRLIDAVREMQADRRGGGQPMAGSDAALEQVADCDDSPSQYVSREELLHLVREKLRPDECRLVDLRAEGLEWADIAQRVGSTAEACRKVYSRALDRVAKELEGIAG